MPAKIAIIGGGAAGVAMCLKLYEQIREGSAIASKGCDSFMIEICVFEKSDTIGPGLSYSTPYMCHLVNLPKSTMIAIYESKYLLQADNSGAENDVNLFNSYLHTDFPPRQLYGKFLIDRAEQLQNEANKHGIVLEYRRNAEVMDVTSLNEENFQIETETEKYTANYVVLCTGNMPSVNYRSLIGKKGYWHQPFYCIEDAKNFDSNKDVVIIGSRTSAVDAALNLFFEEHAQKKAVMVSRSGLLPVVCLQRSVESEYELKYLPEYIETARASMSLDTLLALFWKEISDVQGCTVDFASIIKSHKDISALDWLNKHIKEAEKERPKCYYGQLLGKVFLLIPRIWQFLNENDKDTFLESYYSLFMTYASYIPLEVARDLHQLIKDERLSVRGGVQSITADDSGMFIVRFEDGTSLSTSQLINATGPGHDIDSVPLYRNMCQRGSIAAHRLGGVVVNPETFRVENKAGIENSRMFATGEPTRGVVIATNDVRRANWQAETIAEIIWQDLSAQTTK